MRSLEETESWISNHDEEIQKCQMRCMQILECRRQIAYWKSKHDLLDKEHTRFLVIARLKVDAVTTWKKLSTDERQEKTFIMAALEAPRLPEDLKTCPNSALPLDVINDRDILLARARHPEPWGALYSENAMDWLTPELIADREVFIALVHHFPEIIEFMNTELRDDVGILKEVLTIPSRNLPNKFLECFSDRILSSADVLVNIVLKKSIGFDLLRSYPPTLRNQKDLMMKIITTSRDFSEDSRKVLQFCSKRLKADRDVVECAVEAYGLALKYAAYTLRRDPLIVKKACLQNGKAIKYCLAGETKDSLLRDLEFLKTIVDACPDYVIKHCDPELKDDDGLIRIAMASGLDWSLVPQRFSSDVEFLCSVLKEAPNYYLQLPMTLQENHDTALSSLRSAQSIEDSVIKQIIALHENLPLDYNILKSLLYNVDDPSQIVADLLFGNFFVDHDNILNSKAILLEIISELPAMFPYLHARWKSDPDLIMAAIPVALYDVPDDYQAANPELVIHAIHAAGREGLASQILEIEDINDELFENRDVVRAWLSCGGGWEDELLEFEERNEDKELLLLAVEHNWREVQYASESLKEDKTFLLEALAIDGRVIEYVPRKLFDDPDIMLAAFQHGVTVLFYSCTHARFESAVTFAEWARKEVDAYITFHRHVVPALHGSNTSTYLNMLNQGEVVSEYYSGLLASFVGLASEERFEKLQLASQTLLECGV